MVHLLWRWVWDLEPHTWLVWNIRSVTMIAREAQRCVRAGGAVGTAGERWFGTAGKQRWNRGCRLCRACGRALTAQIAGLALGSARIPAEQDLLVLDALTGFVLPQRLVFRRRAGRSSGADCSSVMLPVRWCHRGINASPRKSWFMLKTFLLRYRAGNRPQRTGKTAVSPWLEKLVQGMFQK